MTQKLTLPSACLVLAHGRESIRARERRFQSSRSGRKTSGFTIVELLITLAVIAILFAIGFVTYGRLNQRLSVESATSELSQTIMEARSQALRSGNSYRVILNTETSYSLEEQTSSGWVSRRTVELTRGITIAAPDAGSTVEFDTRGFANFSPANIIFNVTDGEQSRSLAPAMSGNTKVL